MGKRTGGKRKNVNTNTSKSNAAVLVTNTVASASKQQQHRTKEQHPKLVDHISDDDSDDEEIPEDEAFNSDDELKYGAFFEGKDNGDDNDDDDDEDEDGSTSDEDDNDDDESDIVGQSDDDNTSEDEGEEEGDMMDLLDQLDDKILNSNRRKGLNQQQSSTSSMIANHVKESEFAASVVRQTGLTLENLMEEIKDTKGFGSVQQSMKNVVTGKATSAPVATIVSERIKRKVHYEEQSKEISLWMDAVRKNRNAETLDFRPKERLDITREVMVDKFIPTTDFEKEINLALEQAGQKDEDEILRKEEEALLQDDLGTNTISLEEFKRRQGQLAKMRALMFYHEQKRHHINKIKSKKYRKIRKKQREKQKVTDQQTQLEVDPDLAKELAEKEEYERMNERMTLAHKNTSKWAKRVLKRGKNMDIDTRRALSAQLQRGEDLLKRMNSTTRGGNDDSSNDGDNDNDDSLIESARKVLEDIEENDPSQQEGGHKGLFKLSFMQKGIEKQREIAKQEARQLLLELDVDGDAASIDEREDGYGIDDDDDKDPHQTQQSSGKKQKQKLATKKEMKDVLPDGEMVATTLKMGNSSAVTMSGNIEIDSISQRLESSQFTSGKNVNGKINKTVLVGGDHTATFSVTATPRTTSEKGNDRKLNGKPAVQQRQTEQTKQEQSNDCTQKASESQENDVIGSNPWLTVENVDTAQKKVSTTPHSKKDSLATARFVDVDRAIDLLESTPKNVNAHRDNVVSNGTSTTKSTSSSAIAVPLPSSVPTETQQSITTLTQEQLVRKAFSAITEQEAEEEFAKEKAIVEEREDPTRKIKKEKSMDTVSGWGSWTGAGAPPASKQHKKVPAHLQAPLKKDIGSKRQRADSGKPNVIISHKRNKVLATNYMISHIPYPYTSREEYERAMAGGIGREWNVTGSFRDMTRPEIITKPGKIIQPISKRVKAAVHHRTPAKF